MYFWIKKNMYVNVSNVAMAVAESVEIKTKLAWNFQTEEKFEPQHFYILLSLYFVLQYTLLKAFNWFSVNSSSVKIYFLLQLWFLKRTQNIKISLLINNDIVAFQGYSGGRTFAATARAVSTGTPPASSGKLHLH